MPKKHLGYEFGYVNNNKTTNVMNTQKHHSRIRKFAIEIARALKLQEAGEFVIVFSDESYVNTNHIPGTSWMHEKKKVSRPSGKGERLVILHAISTTDFVCEYTDSGMGIEEGRYGGDGGSLVKRNTAEWIWRIKFGLWLMPTLGVMLFPTVLDLASLSCLMVARSRSKL